MEVDLEREVQSSIFWFDGGLEPELAWLVREFLPVGGTFVDCGANCGYIGLMARRLRHAKVLFVEPHPRLAETVRRNLGLNGWLEECEVVEAAASESAGTVTLFESGDRDGSHSLLADWENPSGSRREIAVAACTLSSLLEGRSGFERVDFLKIDTEGHDVAVLRGMGEWLCPPRVPVIYSEMGRDRESGWELLTRAGYRGFGYRALTRQPMRRLMKRYGEGAPVALFHPLDSASSATSETVWVASRSAAAQFLESLAADAAAQPS